MRIASSARRASTCAMCLANMTCSMRERSSIGDVTAAAQKAADGTASMPMACTSSVSLTSSISRPAAWAISATSSWNGWRTTLRAARLPLRSLCSPTFPCGASIRRGAGVPRMRCARSAQRTHPLRALRHFDTYRGPAMKPWLFAILRNICRSEFSRRSHAPLELNDETPEDEHAIPLWQEVQGSPETEMLQDCDTETIRGLVADLPEPFRETIVL